MEEKPPVIKTMFEKGDYNKFMNIIDGIPWEAEMNKYPEDINKQWDFFKTKFLEAESLCVPPPPPPPKKKKKRFTLEVNYQRNVHATLIEKLSGIWKEKTRCGGK